MPIFSWSAVRRHTSLFSGGAAGAVASLLLCASGAWGQTLARPGWAGSGMTVERWWREAVVYEVKPQSLGEVGAGPSQSTLGRLLERMDDLQSLGVDAVLLRGVDTTPAPGGSAPDGRINPAYGTAEQFDRLMQEASRRRIRLLVELHTEGSGGALATDARFWLSRGVAGLYLPGPPGTDAAGQAAAVRGAVRSYVGQRVLIGEAPDVAEDAIHATFPPPAPNAPRARRRGKRVASSAGAAGDPGKRSASELPDLLLYRLHGLDASGGPVDLTALRASIEHVRRSANATPTRLVDLPGGDKWMSLDEAKARATVLLSVTAAVALPGEDVTADTPDPAAPATASSTAPKPVSPGGNLVEWYRRILGLHRGNASLRSGTETLLDHDAEGALVSVWQGRGAATPTLIGICNLSAKPIRMSLVEDVARLRLRGSFLRTVLRSDGGMGAMPLRSVVLPPFAVYVGELGR